MLRNHVFLLAGRWTQEEHRLFLQGLQLYNKQWKLIADMVKTRTVVQVRTHAQKYFLKMEKGTGVLVGKFSEFQVRLLPKVHWTIHKVYLFRNIMALAAIQYPVFPASIVQEIQQ